MSWLPPTPLLLLAGAIGFVLELPRLEQPTGNLRLVAEVIAIGVLTCAGFAAAWAAYWWIEQRL